MATYPLHTFVSADAKEGALTALTVAFKHGGTDGAHHKDWVIDQMCRAITGKNYEAFVEYAKNGEDGPDTYSWEEGIAP